MTPPPVGRGMGRSLMAIILHAECTKTCSKSRFIHEKWGPNSIHWPTRKVGDQLTPASMLPRSVYGKVWVKSIFGEKGAIWWIMSVNKRRQRVYAAEAYPRERITVARNRRDRIIVCTNVPQWLNHCRMHVISVGLFKNIRYSVNAKIVQIEM